MTRLIIALAFSTAVTYGQTSSDSDIKYTWDYVITYVKKHNMSEKKGTQEIVSEITNATN